MKNQRNCPKFFVATFNTRTLQTSTHLFEISEALKKIKYDVIGLSEVKREGEEILQTSHFTLCTKTDSRIRGSIGFIVRNKWKIQKFKAFSDRVGILIIKINDKDFGFVQGYAPTSKANDDEIDKFYETVEKGIQEVENCHWKVVMGDWNSKIGQCNSDNDVMGKFGFGVRNQRGDRLISFARYNNLFITNSMFKKNSKRRTTWSLGIASNEIDFIMIQNDQKNIVKNVEVLNKFNYESDHKMIRMEIRMDEQIKKRQFNTRRRLCVTEDKSKRKEFIEKMKLNSRYDGAVQEQYNNFTGNLISSSSVFQVKYCRQNVISDETKKEIEKREALRKEKHLSRDKNEEFKNVRRKTKMMIQKDVRKSEVDEMKNAISSGTSWKNAKKGIEKGVKNWIPKLRDKNGQLQSDREKISEIVASFYEDLFESKLTEEERRLLEPDLSEVSDVSKITTNEIREALTSMKNQKAVGEDNIPTELLKICDEEILGTLCKILNEILETEEVPEAWLKSTITLFHKSGDKTEVKNYRPITKTSHLYKLFMKIISNRLKFDLDDHQAVNQAGFRHGFSTTDHLFTIQQLMEKCSEYQKTLFLGFVDFQKAFDSVEHVFLWRALKTIGVDDKYIRLLKNIYEKSTASIELENQSRSFKISRGIKQGCCFSPDLFNAALQEIFKKLKKNKLGIKINEEVLSELRFADDIVLISERKEDLLEMMEELFEESCKVGLRPNIGKTQIMCNTDDRTFKLNGMDIQRTEDYKYLGSIFSFEDNEGKEIQARVAAAWRSFWSHKKYLLSDMPIHLKKRLMDTCILPSLTYGCQCWNFSETALEKLNVEQRNMERRMMKIKKTSHTRNEKMRKYSNIVDVRARRKELKWSWAGHLQRLDDRRWAKKIEVWEPKGRRKKGRPKRRWRDDIEEHGSIFWRRKAQRRDIWKNLGKSFT
jgi:Reverse transcriptase (RNA-dependent DNA polymerase)